MAAFSGWKDEQSRAPAPDGRRTQSQRRRATLSLLAVRRRSPAKRCPVRPIHLGVDADGHTASIFPGVGLDESSDVAVTAVRDGHRCKSAAPARLLAADTELTASSGSCGLEP
jgi:6-phosphogluconolactonase/glucosamine-6-phosphate isomerase/deaminase